MTTPHQGIFRGRLVPSSHKGSKFRYTIVRQFSRGDERIREDIPVPDSLGNETFLVGIVTSVGARQRPVVTGSTEGLVTQEKFVCCLSLVTESINF